MIHSMADRVASIFVLYGEATEENKDIYTYACEEFISTLVNIALCVTIALVFGRLAEAFIFILGFALVRRYTGGHHAKTHWGCIMSFNCMFVLAILLNSIATVLGAESVLVIFASTIALIGVFVIAPTEHANKLLDDGLKLVLKRKSRCLIFVLWAFCIADIYRLHTGVGYTLSLALFFVFISMLYAETIKQYYTRRLVQWKSN